MARDDRLVTDSSLKIPKFGVRPPAPNPRTYPRTIVLYDYETRYRAGHYGMMVFVEHDGVRFDNAGPITVYDAKRLIAWLQKYLAAAQVRGVRDGQR